MFTLVFYFILSLCAIFIVMGFVDSIIELTTGRHHAGVHRYLHDDPVDPLRPADARWMTQVSGR